MFKVDELLKATGGRLISGDIRSPIHGISTDTRTIKRREAFIAIKGDNFDGHDFINEAIKKGASCIIKEQRESNHRPRRAVFIEVKDTVHALGDIARFRRNRFDIPVIAVTGSNGKTTAKEMVAWVLKQKFKVLKNEGTKNNHIGLPMALLNLDDSYDAAVLELGTNHFGEIDYLCRICQPNIGIVTNIGPSHLEYFGSLGGVFKEKYSLVRNLKWPHLAILNSDDIFLRRSVTAKNKRPFVLGFGIRNRCDFFATRIEFEADKITFHTAHKFQIRTLGHHNIYNALAAIGVGRVFGIENKEIAERLASFVFPKGRLSLKVCSNIRFIDDTYNSNPLSLQCALKTLANFKTRGRKILVMGDMLELGQSQGYFHQQAGRQAAKVCDALITIGKLSSEAAGAARRSGLDNKNIFASASCREAKDILLNRLGVGKGDIVLVKGSRAMKMEDIF